MEKEPQLETTQAEPDSEWSIPVKLAKIQERLSERRIKTLVFALIGLLIALILIFGGFKLAKHRQAQLQPIPTPTIAPTYEPTTQPLVEEKIENWKVFKHYNPYERYSINYPANLDVILVGATSGNPAFNFKVEEEVEVNLSVINFFPDKIPPIYDLDKIQQPGEGGYYKLIPNYKEIVKKEEINIAELKGLKVFAFLKTPPIPEFEEEWKKHINEYIILPVEKRVVAFQVDYKFPKPPSLGDIPESATKIVAQMINTYKQLKEPPLSWELYSDEGFPIKANYPPDWKVEQKGNEKDYILSFNPPEGNFGKSKIEFHRLLLPKDKAEEMWYGIERLERLVQSIENAPKETLGLERHAFTFLQGGDYAIKVTPTSRKANFSIYLPIPFGRFENHIYRFDLIVGNEEAPKELLEIFDQMLVSLNKIYLGD